LKLEIYKIQFR